jgi:hypothetical protein
MIADCLKKVITLSQGLVISYNRISNANLFPTKKILYSFVPILGIRFWYIVLNSLRIDLEELITEQTRRLTGNLRIPISFLIWILHIHIFLFPFLKVHYGLYDQTNSRNIPSNGVHTPSKRVPEALYALTLLVTHRISYCFYKILR